MREKYYFCIDIPWENTEITEYDTKDELLKENSFHMKNNDDWYIIKGREVEIKE